jgi:hypothetical protein
MKAKNITTLHSRKSIGPATAGRGYLLIPFAFTAACLALSPQARATCNEGCGASGTNNTFLGDSALNANTTGTDNTAIGAGALEKNVSGNSNTANGVVALYNNRVSDNTATGDAALFTNTTGYDNTANGFEALFTNSTGHDNTATGFEALYKNTANYNTANGAFTLYGNTSGGFNTANGYSAMTLNSSGSDNTATGYSALFVNNGSRNTANGDSALYSNTSGSDNTATGYQALYSNTSGNENTANGYQALFNSKNTTGFANTANGYQALFKNTTGGSNTANGWQALHNNTDGSNNTAIGDTAGLLITGSGNVCIGQGVQGVAGENNTTRIRNIYASVASGRIVYVNSNNKIGTLMSTRRVKENIKPMDKASEAILALKPVSFRYKKEIDASRTPQFGLIAEEVADINPDLVTRDAEGKPETVRYDSINAMLLNEFLKEYRTVQELKSTVAKQEAIIAKQQEGFESKIAHQQTQIEALTAGLQKVSAQVEISRLAPQMVLNNQ